MKERVKFEDVPKLNLLELPWEYGGIVYQNGDLVVFESKDLPIDLGDIGDNVFLTETVISMICGATGFDVRCRDVKHITKEQLKTMKEINKIHIKHSGKKLINAI